jgi:hypothetical protein
MTSDTIASHEVAREGAADATPVSKLARRDGGIALAALSLYAAADAWAASTGLRLAQALTVVDGVVVGILLGTLAHEWGHFAGARGAGGIAPTRPYRSLFPIFDLDMQKSDPHAFRVMSVAGNLAHWALVGLVAALLPVDTAGRAALLAATFGFGVSASATEIPIIRRAFTGSSPVESFKGLTKETLQRDRRIGIAAGVVLFLLLVL